MTLEMNLMAHPDDRSGHLSQEQIDAVHRPNERTAESLTPRTDEACKDFIGPEDGADLLPLCQQLERELAEAVAAADRMRADYNALLEASLYKQRQWERGIRESREYAEGLRTALEAAWKSLSYIQHTYRTAQTHISWDTVFEAIPIVEAALKRSEGNTERTPFECICPHCGIRHGIPGPAGDF